MKRRIIIIILLAAVFSLSGTDDLLAKSPAHLGDGTLVFKLSLGSVFDINRVVIHNGYESKYFCKDFRVLVSADGKRFNEIVKAVLKDNGEAQAFHFETVKAKYVILRVLSGYDTAQWGINEFEVYTVDGLNVVSDVNKGRVIKYTSQFRARGLGSARNINDGAKSDKGVSALAWLSKKNPNAGTPATALNALSAYCLADAEATRLTDKEFMKNPEFARGIEGWAIGFNKDIYQQNPAKVKTIKMKPVAGPSIRRSVLGVNIKDIQSTIRVRQSPALPEGRYELRCEFRTESGRNPAGIFLTPRTYSLNRRVTIIDNTLGKDGWVSKGIRFSSSKGDPRISVGVGIPGFTGNVWFRKLSLRRVPEDPLPIDGLWFSDASAAPYDTVVLADGRIKQIRAGQKRLEYLLDTKSPFIPRAQKYNKLLIQSAFLLDDIKKYRRVRTYLGKKGDLKPERELTRIFSIIDRCNRTFAKLYQEFIPEDTIVTTKLRENIDPALENIEAKLNACQSEVREKLGKYALKAPEKIDMNPDYKIAGDGRSNHYIFGVWGGLRFFTEMAPALGIHRLQSQTGPLWPEANEGVVLDWSNFREFHEEIKLKGAPYFGVRTGFLCGHNNEYLYLRRWIKKNNYFNTPDIWRNRRPRIPVCNFYHPGVRKALAQATWDMASQLKGDPSRLFYHFCWESRGPQLVTSRDNEPQRPSALASFHAFLTKSYGGVDSLNKAWRSTYKHIEDIRFPKAIKTTGTKSAIGNPLVYAVELWRQESYADLAVSLYQAMKQADPDTPVMADHNSLFRNVDPTRVFEYCDLLSSHSGMRKLLCNTYGASNARVQGKYMCIYENNLGDHSALGDEQLWFAGWNIHLYTKALQNQYLQFMGGPFGGSSGWIWQQGKLGQPATDYMTLRYFATHMPVCIRRLRRLEKTLLHTSLARSDTLLIFPRTSWLSMGFGAVRDPLLLLVRHLSAQNVPYEFRSEADLVSGKETLENYKVVILPVGAFLDDGIDDKLLAWVRKGGVLVLFGPAGVYSKHGFVNGKLMRLLVGKLPQVVATPDRGDWVWKWRGEAARKDLIRKKIDQGEILMTTLTFDEILKKKNSLEEILATIQRVVPRFSSSDGPSLSLWNMVDEKGGKYLGVINHDRTLDVKRQIRLRGTFKQVIDMDIPGEFLIPVRHENNSTYFSVRLQPGGMTVLRLADHP